MTTAARVVNVKVAHIRPQYQKEWCGRNVYVGRQQVVFVDGRRYPPVASPFANPYRCAMVQKGVAGGREEAVERYRALSLCDRPVWRRSRSCGPSLSSCGAKTWAVGATHKLATQTS